jgi:hypothetical protein
MLQGEMKKTCAIIESYNERGLLRKTICYERVCFIGLEVQEPETVSPTSSSLYFKNWVYWSVGHYHHPCWINVPSESVTCVAELARVYCPGVPRTCRVLLVKAD